MQLVIDVAREAARPVELAPNRDGDTLRLLYEALNRLGSEVSWLRFEFASINDRPRTGTFVPRYRLTAQWINGPNDPPQPGPRHELERQLEWVDAYVEGWLAGMAERTR